MKKLLSLCLILVGCENAVPEVHLLKELPQVGVSASTLVNSSGPTEIGGDCIKGLPILVSIDNQNWESLEVCENGKFQSSIPSDLLTSKPNSLFIKQGNGRFSTPTTEVELSYIADPSPNNPTNPATPTAYTYVTQVDKTPETVSGTTILKMKVYFTSDLADSYKYSLTLDGNNCGNVFSTVLPINYPATIFESDIPVDSNNPSSSFYICVYSHTSYGWETTPNIFGLNKN